MSNKIVVKSELTINAPVERVWSFLTLPKQFPRLFSPTATADFAAQKGSLVGSMTLGELNFKLTLTPYDLLLSSPACTIVMRLAGQADGRCHAVMAASCVPESGFAVRERDLFNVLSRLRSVTGYPEDETLPAPSTPSENRTVYRGDRGASEKSFKPTPSTAKPKRVTTAKGTPWKPILIGVVALAVIGIAALTIPKLTARAGRGDIDQSAAHDLSALVNLDTARSLLPGASRREVEQLFGTSGVKLSGDRYVYRSDATNTAGQPLEQVCVDYSNGTVRALTYLNLTNSTVIGLQNTYPVISATDLDGIIAQAGAPLSMFRLSADGDAQQLEAHFGYLDPFANFDPAWRGEIAVTVRPDGSLSTDFCRGYDGSDPLLVASLENSPLAAQYDSYTVYLQDKYQYDKALLMTNGFSRGDAQRIFGAMSEYDAGSGAMAMRTASAEMLPDGTTPLYQYSFGFEGNGAFNMSAFVNMRLLNKAGMLDNTRWQAVTRNMSYGEVRVLTGILPTAVYVNDNSLLLCYGCYVGGGETEQQFELVVKLDRATMLSENVYFNSKPAGA